VFEFAGLIQIPVKCEVHLVIRFLNAKVNFQRKFTKNYCGLW